MYLYVFSYLFVYNRRFDIDNEVYFSMGDRDHSEGWWLSSYSDLNIIYNRMVIGFINHNDLLFEVSDIVYNFNFFTDLILVLVINSIGPNVLV